MRTGKKERGHKGTKNIYILYEGGGHMRSEAINMISWYDHLPCIEFIRLDIWYNCSMVHAKPMAVCSGTHNR